MIRSAVQLARAVEKIYVLEPWYSKMRQELKDEGWVQDNVFWERCKRTLDKLTTEVILWMGQQMIYSLWSEGVGDDVDDLENLYWFQKFGLGYGRADEVVFRMKDAKQVTAEEIKEYYPETLRLYSVSVPFRSILFDGHTLVRKEYHNKRSYWAVEEKPARRVWARLRQFAQREYKWIQKNSQFPYSGSAEQEVRARQPGTHMEDDRPGGRYWFNIPTAKALDRMRDSLSKSIPERLLAINIAINTEHTAGKRGGAINSGLDEYDLDRWSRMGVQSKATAKQYLEHVTSEAIDMLLEGCPMHEALTALF